MHYKTGKQAQLQQKQHSVIAEAVSEFGCFVQGWNGKHGCSASSRSRCCSKPYGLHDIATLGTAAALSEALCPKCLMDLKMSARGTCGV